MSFYKYKTSTGTLIEKSESQFSNLLGDESQIELSSTVESIDLNIQPLHFYKYDGNDIVPNSDQNIDDLNRAVIKDLVTKELSNRSHIDINYITELDDNIKLTPIRTFLTTGLLDTVIFYKDYVDSNNKGVEVLRVDHTWVLDDDVVEPLKSAKKVISRSKKRRWKNKDGLYNKKEKNTVKLYVETGDIGKEGRRRRQNLIDSIQYGTAVILLTNGVYSTSSEVELQLIDSMDLYNKDINVYLKSGKGDLYTSIQNDITFGWFDQTIGISPRDSLSLDVGWENNTIRDFIIEKLKGEI